jgi:SAM-dependent methyltransferase
MGGKVIGIDISPTSIDIAAQRAATAGVHARFCVMDAEETSFEDGQFDIVVCSGVLHHMDLPRAYAEVARILKEGGTAIALEGLGSNPLINWYRRRTPDLRSPDEHPLKPADLDLARRYFGNVHLRFFNLATLAAAPLWKTPLCRPAARALGVIDAGLLRLPPLQPMAWMAGMLMSQPRHD